MPLRFAVMGNPIAHSLSPKIHQQFAKEAEISLTYEKMLVSANCFENSVESFFSSGGNGLNITHPFKERAFLLAKKVTKRAQVAQSVNTLWLQDGELHGDTTDGAGFILDFLKIRPLTDTHILILGAGGAARAIIPALIDLQVASLTIQNRTKAREISLQKDFPMLNKLPQNKFDIIINATPNLLIPQCSLIKSSFCYDLNYHPTKPTPFVSWAYSQGLVAKDGFGMLVAQAALAFEIWHGIMPAYDHREKHDYV